MFNLLLNTDSYKASHWLQYPPNTEYVFCYIESRGGKYDQTVFFGLQMFIQEYLTKPITQELIDEAALFWPAHGEPFNKEGWQYILDELGGYLPLEIKSVAEGTVVPISNALATIVNTDPKCFWLPSHVESSILRAVWYPTTVATNSWTTRQVITKYMKETSDLIGDELEAHIDLMLHDFGSRGVSSLESACIGGAAHLINFRGSDNVPGIWHANKHYFHKMAGVSVPASEHSSITTWLKKGELKAYRNMIKQYGGKFPAFAVVSDSYDIFNAVEKMWGAELKDEVIQCGSMLVIRPDSGDPTTVVAKILLLLETTYGYKYNSKRYKVLNNVRVLQGDGITTESIESILSKLIGYKFSAENVLFGQGGALLQQLDRDTCQWAYKACAAYIDSEWVDVFKDPITDSGKRSKRGRLMLYKNDNSDFITAGINAKTLDVEQLTPIFLNGKLMKTCTLDEVRQVRFETTR